MGSSDSDSETYRRISKDYDSVPSTKKKRSVVKTSTYQSNDSRPSQKKKLTFKEKSDPSENKDRFQMIKRRKKIELDDSLLDD